MPWPRARPEPPERLVLALPRVGGGTGPAPPREVPREGTKYISKKEKVEIRAEKRRRGRKTQIRIRHMKETKGRKKGRRGRGDLQGQGPAQGVPQTPRMAPVRCSRA